MHRADEARIKAAAAATGLQEADFIRQAALLRAQEVEQRMALSILPLAAFEAFKAAVETPSKAVPGLARAAKTSEGRLTDARLNSGRLASSQNCQFIVLDVLDGENFERRWTFYTDLGFGSLGDPDNPRRVFMSMADVGRTLLK